MTDSTSARLSDIGNEIEKLENDAKDFPFLQNAVKDDFLAIKRALRQFSSPVTVIATVGMLKAGKSTLVNLFAGSKFASPIGFGFDTTLRPALIRMAKSGEEPKITCYFHGTLPSHMTDESTRLLVFDYYRGIEDAVPSQVYKSTYKLDEKHLQECLCMAPSDSGVLNAEPIMVVVETPYTEAPCLLADNCLLLDLPGLDSGHADIVKEEHFLNIISESDIVLFVQSSVSPLNEKARDILKSILGNRNSETAQIVHNEIKSKPWQGKEVQDDAQNRQAQKAIKEICDCLPNLSRYAVPRWNRVNLGMAYDAVFGDPEKLNKEYVFDDGTPLSAEELKHHSQFFSFSDSLQESMRKRGRHYRFLHCQDELVQRLRQLSEKTEKYLAQDLTDALREVESNSSVWETLESDLKKMAQTQLNLQAVNPARMELMQSGAQALQGNLQQAEMEAELRVPQIQRTGRDEVKGSFIDKFLDNCSHECRGKTENFLRNQCLCSQVSDGNANAQTMLTLLNNALKDLAFSLNAKQNGGSKTARFYGQILQSVPDFELALGTLLSLAVAVPYTSPNIIIKGGKSPFERHEPWISFLGMEFGDSEKKYERNYFQSCPTEIMQYYENEATKQIQASCKKCIEQKFCARVKEVLRPYLEQVGEQKESEKERLKKLNSEKGIAEKIKEKLVSIGNDVRALSQD